MLFDTLAEYDAEITAVRAKLTKSMDEQGHTSGGPGAGMALQRGDVRAIREYLELLSRERAVMKSLEAGTGSMGYVQFERPT